MFLNKDAKYHSECIGYGNSIRHKERYFDFHLFSVSTEWNNGFPRF